MKDDAIYVNRSNYGIHEGQAAPATGSFFEQSGAQLRRSIDGNRRVLAPVEFSYELHDYDASPLVV